MEGNRGDVADDARRPRRGGSMMRFGRRPQTLMVPATMPAGNGLLSIEPAEVEEPPAPGGIAIEPCVRVLAVEPHWDSTGLVTHHGVDLPVAGQEGDTYSLTITGWALGGRSRVGGIEVTHEGSTLRQMRGGHPREDVARLHPNHPQGGQSGYYAQIGVLGLPRRFTVEVAACLDDGGRMPLASITCERRGLETGYRPALQPAMLTSLGRTGTTLLMRLLSELPNVVAHRDYPLELGAARYWTHMLRVLTDPANHEQSSHPETFGADLWYYGGFLAGAEEVTRWLGSTHVEEAAAFTQQSIDGLYMNMALAQGIASPRYFAEKNLPDHIAELTWDLYPDGREIILFRDPRDVLCSILAFNAKRGYTSFSRTWSEHGGAPRLETGDVGLDVLVDDLTSAMKALQQAAAARGDRALVLRYEDVVEQPLWALDRMARYLGVDIDETGLLEASARALAETPELQQHRTTASVPSSVGRWRGDLGPEAGDAIDKLTELAVCLGYPAG
jgi:hypothetical protein